jgi:hypothetical protein
MSFFRKNIFPFALLALLAFSTLLAAEGFHHHSQMENQDCSYCSWQQNTSQASSLPAAPLLFPLLLAFVLFVLQSLFISNRFISPSGRSPPSNLL